MTSGGVPFSEVVAQAEHASPRAIEIGNRFADAIPPPDVYGGQGLLHAAVWWAQYVGKIVPLWPGNHDRAKEARGDILGHGWTVDDVASRDLAQVAEWWTDGPFSNIGFATRSNGIVIIDLDPRHGGLERWRTLCVQHGIDDRDVPRSVSPRNDGGQHLWFRVPEAWTGAGGILYPHSSLMPGVDRPWQVPVQPSMRVVTIDHAAKDPGGRTALRMYRWLAGDPRALPDAPPVLLGDQLERPQSVSAASPASVAADAGAGGAQPSTRSSIDATFGQHEPLDVAALARAGVPVGEQSYTFKRMACSMVARGWDDGTICAVLLKTAEQSPVGDPDDPWTISDIAPMVTHARRYIERSRAAELLASQQYAANLTRRWR